MSPEELAEARHYAACYYQAGYVHDLMHNFLAHIDQQAARIAVLEAQVTTLKKIAISERSRCIRTESYDHCEGMYRIDLPEAIESSRRQLAEEHPEAF